MHHDMMTAPLGVPGLGQLVGTSQLSPSPGDEPPQLGTFTLRYPAISPDRIVQVLAVADGIARPVGGVALGFESLTLGGFYLCHSRETTLPVMAGVELKAGAYLDFVSPKEMHEELTRLQGFVQDLLRQEAGETVVVLADPFLTNATGKGQGTVYRIPAGYEGYVTRLVVTWPTATAKTGTACTLLVCSDSVSASSTRAINNTVPSVFDASRSHAPLFHGGQAIVVSLKTGPHTQTIFCSAQIILVRRQDAGVDVMETGGDGT